MDDNLQKCFVAEHDGSSSSFLATGGCCSVSVMDFFAQPIGDIACLNVFSRCSDIADMLVLAEIIIDFIGLDIQFVGEILQVLTDILSCLMFLHVIMVEVPIEAGFPFLHQVAEQLLLHLLKQIEAYKQIVTVWELSLLFFYNLPI